MEVSKGATPKRVCAQVPESPRPRSRPARLQVLPIAGGREAFGSRRESTL